ncbi:MAG: hypothetical protein M1833_005990 [Piccolia ochrophora]|nr:MAG: hypothetical protein M1833_005990 [Piccolia ochrophora]
MASSFEKSVKGGTKIKLAAPKSKYVEHILVATHAGEAGVAEVFRTLQNRLRDSTWTIVFKGLIIVHLMIREGEPDVTLKYIAANPRKIAISSFSDVQLQGRNIRHYTTYLLERAKTFKETRVDFVRMGEGRLKRLTVEKGLLRETEAVQSQVIALLKCDVLSNEPENEITLTAFRLLVTDLLVLFHAMNEGVINILEHFFEMSKYDAERALAIYKTFTKQTNLVVEYLSMARQYEHATRVEVPKLKHAPTGLTSSLEDYLHDPDFEINRRQYLAQQEAKKGKGKTNGSNKPFPTDGTKASNSRAATGKDFPSPKQQQSAPVKQEAKGPAPDLIDFFESIEQNQQPMAQPAPQQQQPQPPPQFQQAPQFQQQPQQLQYQQTNFAPAQSVFGPQQPQGPGQQFGSPFPQQSPPSFSGQSQQQQTVQTDFTGAGFGGYTPQTQSSFTGQQPSATGTSLTNATPFDNAFQQQQASGPMGNGASQQNANPFRQSMLPSNSTGMSSSPFTSSSTFSSPINRQNTNPFAQSNPLSSSTTGQPSPFAPHPASPPTTNLPPQPSQFTQQLQPTPTGTNPFARNPSPMQQQNSAPPAGNPVTSNATGSTNPFRQSMFHNQQTGAGWQQGQGTMGGLEQLPTVNVFPRPGEQQAGPGGSPWS